MLKDGTYDKPVGNPPAGLFWDNIRGLWAPPDLLNEGADRSESQSKKKRKRTDTCDSENDGLSSEDDEYHVDEDEFIGGSRYRHLERKSLRTSDGCLLPRRQPIQNKDGTYAKPTGTEPENLKWDSIRGLWAPKNSKKEKKMSTRSSILSSSSEKDRTHKQDGNEYDSDDNNNDNKPTVIKASEANLFHHSTPMWRSFCQFKKYGRKRKFQARTKSNPIGIVNTQPVQLNKSNWSKIPKLKQKQSSVPPTNTSIPDTCSDDGYVQLV